MKLGVSITAFREKHIIPIIHQYEGIADKIVVAVSKTPWFGPIKPDNTAEKAYNTSAIVLEYDWKTEAEQRNWTMSEMKDCDYVIVSHCDTFFTANDLKKIKEQLTTASDLHYTCNVKTYWKNYDTVIDPDIGLPTLFVRKDAVFTNAINVKDQLANPKKLDAICYHTSWVKSDEEVLTKILSYSHASEIPKGWYEECWLKWHEGMMNFAPTNRKDYRTTRIDPLPEEIRRKL